MESTAGSTAEWRSAFDAVAASVAGLDVFFGAGADSARHGEAGPSDADPLRQLADDCLDTLAEIARLESRTAALKVRTTATYLEAATAIAPPAASPREQTAQEMSIVAEIACVLTVSERTAGALIAESHALTTGLPRTLLALQAGAISWQHARIMIDEAASLGPAGVSSLESHFLDPDAANPARGCPAGDLVPSRFRAKARTWRERHHPVSIEKRHATSVSDRRFEYAPDRDGMAWISAYLPADTASGIWNRTTSAARALQSPTEPRTLSQLRADIAAIWLLGAAGTVGAAGTAGTAGTAVVSAGGEPAGAPLTRVPSPAAQVLVTVPVFSLLSLTDEPAMLDGYGPIPASMARALVADGATSFHRVLTDPMTGAPLEIGRTKYRIPAAMRQWLRLRDGKCPFPGCNGQSLDNEADHLLAWADGGTTGINNLGQPCRKHHKLKHTTQWAPAEASRTQPPGWTSPAGRYYPSEQQDWEPPHSPLPILLLQDRVAPDGAPSCSVVEDPPPANLPPGDPGPEDPLPDAVWRAIPAEDPLPKDPLPDAVWRAIPADEPLPEDPLPDAVWRAFPADEPFPDWDVREAA